MVAECDWCYEIFEVNFDTIFCPDYTVNSKTGKSRDCYYCSYDCFESQCCANGVDHEEEYDEPDVVTGIIDILKYKKGN